MLYPCLLSNIIYPLYLGGGCGRGVGHPNILGGRRGGTLPPSHHPLEASGTVRSASRPSDMAIPAFRAAPERLRRLRSGSRMPPITSWTVQNGEKPIQNYPKLNSCSGESAIFTFLKNYTFAQIEPANDAPGAPPRRHF